MGIRKFLSNLLSGKSKQTPPSPSLTSATGQPVTQITLAVYIDQIAAYFKTLSEVPDSLVLLRGLKPYLQASKLDWKSAKAVDAHLRRLSMDKLYDLMELLGYEVHHVLPVDTFDLSWAFREHFEKYKGSDRIAFNAEFIPGQSPEQRMLNALQLLKKRQLLGGKVFGVHGVHPDYNVAISRYLDLRQVEIIADLKLQVDASGINLKPADFEKAVQAHFQQELISFTRKIRHRLIEVSVSGNNGTFVAVNDLFGSQAELQKDDAFLRRMKNL